MDGIYHKMYFDYASLSLDEFADESWNLHSIELRKILNQNHEEIMSGGEGVQVNRCEDGVVEG